ncbi:GlsB/YeaQ/YmgE family stress response membrane protein [Mycolicibacterium confluentis]|uniref:Transglycosylase n=1 Tax=Mycolicibacterium confluentis TaxID=28047 RepID=A0A7I7XXF3_9MYCO|nr:transglycosylase [Mycolicibacterium confluentis]MCV7318452.1 GlsB/YeaQ/YmgE family stress response membrane protein [Mycolicibacterium confluentis]ORV20278.1 transglycosylase [Mycolicibacterium confluentis]BBZ34008.1 transglycosylase [Mycolicibacterium confluentis]
MTITGIISAILIGALVGVLARLVLPGKQSIGVLLTVIVGIISALLGTALARAMGIPTATNGVDWLELLVQVVVAIAGVALVTALMGRRRRSGLLRR